MTYIVKFPWYSISKKELLLGPLLTKCGYFVKQTPEMVPDDYNFNIVMSRGQPFSVIYIHIAAIISSFYVHATTSLSNTLPRVAHMPYVGWTKKKKIRFIITFTKKNVFYIKYLESAVNKLYD